MPLAPIPAGIDYAFPMLALAVLLAAIAAAVASRQTWRRRLGIFLLCAAALYLARGVAPRPIVQRDLAPRFLWPLFGWDKDH